MGATKQGWIKRKENGNGAPWNKGLTGLPKHTEEHKRKIGLKSLGNKYRLGTKHTQETKDKIADSHKGEKAYQWKGGFSYNANRRARLRNAEGQFTRLEWEELKKKYGYMCLCCKKTEPEIKLCADHIIPLSKGGRNDISNIQPLCRLCNGIKAVKTIDFINNFQITVA